MFIIKIKKSVLITCLGVIFGVLSMYFAFSKIAFLEVSYVRYSLIFLLLAGICDMFDGKVARMCKRSEYDKKFGIQIDSLADTVSFVCLPVVIMLSLGMDSIVSIIGFVLFILCGVLRLAHFNVLADADEPVKYYSGLPVTTTAFIFPLLGLLHGIIPEESFEIVYLIATYIIACLFILNVKVPKLKGKAYIVVPIISIILVILLLVIR